MNTNTGNMVFICATPQPFDLSEAVFSALSWVQVKAIGSLGETGTATNLLSYNTLDTTVVQKAKGISDAGSPILEVARLPTDAGQIALRNAAKTSSIYAFKIVRNDGTTEYQRGLVTGPARPNGRNEDFDLENYTLGFMQAEVTGRDSRYVTTNGGANYVTTNGGANRISVNP